MKIRTTEALKAFEKSVEQCAGSVYLKSVNGECYDLKKEELRSQGIRRLMEDEKEELELFVSNRYDNMIMLRFFVAAGEGVF
ncbi:hypothetical protein B5F29_09175 [Lachnoclostridium sp. An196]|uniref:hypothetical protein n=1 Tax=Lachnoclostridium sp. An196 TaxID=1965583 RepID=UPI000B3947C4|nr:hypothetical protein [Lachnoclostridium sp. An196]OUP19491.1 hypothetical protein B5F29_09175 [Lachnoclostridium sp. An196]